GGAEALPLGQVDAEHEADRRSDHRDDEEPSECKRGGDVEGRPGDAGVSEAAARHQILHDLAGEAEHDGTDGDRPGGGASCQPRPQHDRSDRQDQARDDGEDDPGEAHQDQNPDDDLADRIHAAMLRARAGFRGGPVRSQAVRGLPLKAVSPGSSGRALIVSCSVPVSHNVAWLASPNTSNSGPTSSSVTSTHLQPKPHSSISSWDMARGQSFTSG